MAIKLSNTALKAIEMAYQIVTIRQSLQIAQNLEEYYLDQVSSDEINIVRDRIEGIYARFNK